MTDEKYFSQWGQDKIIDQILKGKKKGVYIDIGAHDGITFSNSYFFEKYRNWTGICIEPNPNVFKKLVLNRPNTKNLDSVVYDVDGKLINFVVLSGYTEMLSGVINDYDNRHLQRINNELDGSGGSHQILKIETITLNKVLTDNLIDYVDLLSL